MKGELRPMCAAQDTLRGVDKDKNRCNSSVEYGISIIVLLIISSIVASCFSGRFVKTPILSQTDFAISAGWFYSDGTPITPDNSKGLAWNAGRTLSIFRRFAKEDFGKALYFRNHRQDVTVIADGQILYDTYGTGSYHLRHCFNGYCMAVLPYSEQPYTVELRFAPTADSLCTIPEIMLDNPSTIETSLLHQSSTVLIQSIIFLTIAALSLCVFFVIRANSGNGKAVFFGSVYIICQTLWSLTDADIINILPISNEFTDVAGYFLIVLRFVFLIAFGKEFVESKRQKPLSFSIWLLLIFQAVQSMLYLSGFCRLYDLHRYTIPISATALTVFAVCMIRELFYRRSHLLGFMTFGAATNAALIITSQFLYLSPAVSVTYQKIYRPFMVANDWLLTTVLIAVDVMSAVQAITSKIRNAEAKAHLAATQALEYQMLADQDSLTGLMNHRAIIQCLEDCANGSVPFAVGFVDLDDFRSVNSEYGHIVGDEVLSFVARALKRVFGDLCGRQGGDEFLFLVNQSEQLNHLDELLMLFQHILQQDCFIPSIHQHIKISSSIGVELVSDLPQNHNTIIKRADELMYQVKAQGKNKFAIETM